MRTVLFLESGFLLTWEKKQNLLLQLEQLLCPRRSAWVEATIKYHNTSTWYMEPKRARGKLEEGAIECSDGKGTAIKRIRSLRIPRERGVDVVTSNFHSGKSEAPRYIEPRCIRRDLDLYEQDPKHRDEIQVIAHYAYSYRIPCILPGTYMREVQ